MRMPFGKHKHKLISDLPDDYIIWLLKELDEKHPVRELFQDEFNKRRNPTKLLEVSETNLKTAYKKMAMKYHPDKGGNNLAMQVINEFYDLCKELCK